jgi:hypothetical protein
MRWLLSITVAFVWSAVVQAKSFTGDRLLVVLEDQAERENYSVFLEDLTCKLIHYFDSVLNIIVCQFAQDSMQRWSFDKDPKPLDL